MAEVRLELSLPSEPRTPSLEKDSLLTNCFIEVDTVNGSRVVKRPGLVLDSSVTTTSLGVFYYDGSVFYITSAGALASFVPSP